MGSTVDGLVSGMDTTSMIASMMQIESQPKTKLQAKVKTAQTTVSSYQSLNSKVSALKSAADDLGQLSSWRSIKPTVSSAAATPTSVTATATGGTSTATGSVTFDVVSLAKAQADTARVASTGDITTADSIQVSIGSAGPVTIDISADKSASGIAGALNKAGLGVKASVNPASVGNSDLQFTGTKTGAANNFTVTGLSGVTVKPVTAASDAVLHIAGRSGDPADAYDLTSTTNTFTDLMAGVSLTVAKVESGVTLDSAPDVAGIAAKFKALVDAANGTLTEVSKQTAYDAANKIRSPLTGDFMVRQMSQSILGSVSSGLSYTDTSATVVKFGSLSKLGIQLDKTGQLSFDAAKFTAAYNADPTSIQAAGIALGDSFESLAGKQGDNVTRAITSRTNQVDSLNVQIDDWDVRLSARKDALQRTYGALEASLGKLKNQSTWLSGQIASLG
jgi:flagellar hook-associated protein 2